jgi:hypothetical protein
MKPDGSYAVMSNRKSPKEGSFEDFPTPPWQTRAFIEKVLAPRYPELRWMTAWEPSCNRGYMSRPLSEYFQRVFSSDIHAYGWDGQEAIHDFLGNLIPPFGEADWIIMNPPFSLAEEFIIKAKSMARCGVAVIVRSVFLEGSGRYTRLFKSNPPQIIAQCVERVPMVKGRFDPKASTATAYSWLVWEKHGRRDPQFVWIPPCRKEMERAEDSGVLGNRSNFVVFDEYQEVSNAGS